MRPELLHDRISAYLPEASAATAAAGPRAAAEAARDLFDLLAVIIGICESLASGLAHSARHAELARVGLLAADRAAAIAADLRARAMAAAPARRVLVVEDDPDLLNLLTAAFAREGFETHGASNGRVGVEMLTTLAPDLMVTDIVMPEMEGIAAILEARRASPKTKVIAISGGGHYGRSGNFLAWAQELGADEVLAKPFRMSSLITAARLVLDRPTAANESAAPASVSTDEAAAR